VVAGLVAVAALVLVGLTDFNNSNSSEIEQEVIAANYLIDDERSVLWADTWRMQLDAQPLPWIVGHGTGGFQENFPEYSRFPSIGFVFPHNFMLEVLHNNGLIGLLTFTFSLVAYFYFSIKSYRASTQNDALLLALALFVAVLLFTFLTLPLLSRYTTYTLGFVVGFSLWLRQTGIDHADLQR
jgi:O-antigen ligase